MRPSQRGFAEPEGPNHRLKEGVGLMDWHDRTHRRNRDHRVIPTALGLESRQLLSFFAPFSGASTSFFGYSSSNQQLAARAAIVRHEYDTYVSTLKALELGSQATPEEFRALRDDAREISATAAATTLSPSLAKNKAVEVSLQLDRSPLYGWTGAAAWAEVSARLTTNLQALGIPQPLIDQTLADDKAIGVSAGVDFPAYQTFTNDFNTLRAGEASLPSNPSYHFTDPGLFYTQHLRGFFRGWGVQKVAAEAQLKSNLRTIQIEVRPKPSDLNVLHRDVRLLQNLGAALPSTSVAALYTSFVAAFAHGAPTPDDLPELRASLLAAEGAAGTVQRIAWVNQLVADAPTFARAAGSSDSRVETVVNDVSAVVDSGGGESLNPFKVSIQHTVGMGTTTQATQRSNPGGE
jgi:hypothetical protein